MIKMRIRINCSRCGHDTYATVKKVEDHESTYEWACLSCLKKGRNYNHISYWTNGFHPKEEENEQAVYLS